MLVEYFYNDISHKPTIDTNIRYNEESDYVEVFHNNIWNKILKAGLLTTPVLLNGKLYYDNPLPTAKSGTSSASFDGTNIILRYPGGDAGYSAAYLNKANPISLPAGDYTLVVTGTTLTTHSSAGGGYIQLGTAQGQANILNYSIERTGNTPFTYRLSFKSSSQGNYYITLYSFYVGFAVSCIEII